MVYAQFFLGTLETFLDGPSQPGGSRRLRPMRTQRSKRPSTTHGSAMRAQS